MLQIVQGLKYLHQLKITHGNLKPANILICLPKGDLYPSVKLSDFGIRHAVINDFGTKNQKKRFLPAYTKGWMCPTDAVNNEGLRNPSFDIFPLGLILGFTASNGIHPYGRDLDEAIKRIRKKCSIKISLEQLGDSVRSVAFLELLTKMLNFNASNRPLTSEILDYLLTKINPVMEAEPEEKTQYVEPVIPLSTSASLPSISGESPAKKLRLTIDVEESRLSDRGPVKQEVLETMQQINSKYVL